ncbi:TPA: hypothetical protein ACH0UC_005041 [Escherichia coli]
MYFKAPSGAFLLSV